MSGAIDHRPPAPAPEAFDAAEPFPGRRRVAVVTGDTLGRRLSGPGIRTLELARVLAEENDVRVYSTTSADLDVPGIPVRVAGTDEQVRGMEAWAEVIVFQGFLLCRHPWLLESSRTIVADLYDPFHLEQLEQFSDRPQPERDVLERSTVLAVNQQLARGDYFLCASPKQRDFWLGQLAGVGRLNARNYDKDKSLRSLIGVVPFGISEKGPVKGRTVLRGVVDGIGPDDRILFWGGGLYPWFDPHILVHAVDRLRRTIPNVRLVFLAGRHPSPDVPPMATIGEVRTLAAELDLHAHVFFIDSWVDYDDRQNYLLEADVGVSTHRQHIETEFSFRTRIFDYIWAGLPIVTSSGDSMGDLVERERLGRTVPPGDADALASALEDLLGHPEELRACGQRVAAVAPAHQWRAVTGPLVEFCRHPVRAPDLVDGSTYSLLPVPENHANVHLHARVKRLAGLSLRSVQDDGWSVTVRRVVRRLAGKIVH